MRQRDDGWKCPRCGYVADAHEGRTCPECTYNGDWIQPGEAHLYLCAARISDTARCDCVELSKSGGLRRVFMRR